MSEYTVCVNQPGCLPDSDDYPYRVSTLEDALDALQWEMDGFDPIGGDPEPQHLQEEAEAELVSGGSALIYIKGYHLAINRD